MVLPADVERWLIAWELQRRLVDPLAAPEPPAHLPPVSVLVPRTFSPSLLERRLRFLAATGQPPVGVVDRAAAAWQDPDTDRHLAALLRAAPDPAAIAEWDAFFDETAERLHPQSGPAYRAVPPHPPAWSRLEACTVDSDRWFGRQRRGRAWAWAARLTAGAGEQKRRMWR